MRNPAVSFVKNVRPVWPIKPLQELKNAINKLPVDGIVEVELLLKIGGIEYEWPLKDVKHVNFRYVLLTGGEDGI